MVHLVRRGKTDEYPVRISKSMLRIFLAESLLEDMVNLRASEPSGAPEGCPKPKLRLHDILKTCRHYDGDVQQAVQLLSWLVARTAFFLMTLLSRPAPTLMSLRPGAKRLNDPEGILTKSIAQWGDAAHAAVEFAKPDSRDQALATAAAIKLVSRQYLNETEQSTVALPLEGTDGVDAAVQLKKFNGKSFYVMQTKGQKSGQGVGGGADTRSRQGVPKDHNFERREVARFMKQNFDGPGLEHEVMALELMATRPTPMEFTEHFDGFFCPVLLLDHESLYEALGPVFGGIAARCVERAQLADASGSAGTATAASSSAAGSAGADGAEPVGKKAKR